MKKLPALFAFVLLAACGSGNGTVHVKLTDAPGDFEAVNVTITRVEAHLAQPEGDAKSGWEVLAENPGTFDLLELQNDVTAVLGDASLPAGKYTQIRFVLTAAEVVVDGATHPLTVPSGETSGLKLQANFTVEADTEYEMILDFDAGESIKQSGNGYKLAPVIKLKSFNAEE